MAEVSVAMAEVTLASVVEVAMAMLEVNHHRATTVIFPLSPYVSVSSSRLT